MNRYRVSTGLGEEGTSRGRPHLTQRVSASVGRYDSTEYSLGTFD